jgi:hypothetical protein
LQGRLSKYLEQAHRVGSFGIVYKSFSAKVYGIRDPAPPNRGVFRSLHDQVAPRARINISIETQESRLKEKIALWDSILNALRPAGR